MHPILKKNQQYCHCEPVTDVTGVAISEKMRNEKAAAPLRKDSSLHYLFFFFTGGFGAALLVVGLAAALLAGFLGGGL